MGEVKVILTLSLMMLLSACLNTTNSNTSDLGFIDDGDGSDLFVAAKSILSSKCISCHSHATWASYNEDEYVDNLLIEFGSLENSELYYWLKGATVVNSSVRTPMPPTGNLTAGELKIIRDWILDE